MYLKNSLIVILFFVLSCQPIEILKPIEIDVSNFEKISINTKEIEINTKCNPVFTKNNIEDQIQNPPIELMIKWNNENIPYDLKIHNWVNEYFNIEFVPAKIASNNCKDSISSVSEK